MKYKKISCYYITADLFAAYLSLNFKDFAIFNN